MKLRKPPPQAVTSITWPRHKGLSFCFALGLVLLSMCAQATPIPDIRVLIDISGSMKQNDPHNLRASALRMLVGLLPNGTRSGVWTFGQYVNMQVKLGKVNRAWKQKAMIAAGEISSHGLHTNIEAAVRKATFDWTRPDPAYKRRLILLTDGMIDLGKGKQADADSRRRLLQEILPRLEAAHVEIHTIALSKTADKELLSRLSAATGGAFVQVDNAATLRRVFLKLFEKSVSADSLPIESNKFNVDKEISDFTVLVFLAKDSPATKLYTPAGHVWSQRVHPSNVSWYHDPGYDLISVKAPQPGQWRLQAKVDPDNRVMIITNLRLKADKIPNTLLLGDEFDVRARLLQDGRTLDSEKLLSTTHFTLAESKAGSDKTPVSMPMHDDGRGPDVLKGDGVYSVHVPTQDSAGTYDLVLEAKGLTFERELHFSLQVHASPAIYTISQAGPKQAFRLTIRPHAGLIRPESISMQVSLPGASPQILTQVGDLEWQTEIPASFANKHISITLVGKRYNNSDLKMNFDQILAVTGKPLPLTLKPKQVNEQPAVPAKHKAAKTKTQAPEKTVPKKKEHHVLKAKKRGFNWTIVIIMVVGVNLFVILASWFGYSFWKKRKARAVAEVAAGVSDE